jgi:hypothetical protein
MKLDQIIQEFAKQIDDIKYTDKPKTFKVSKDITIGWKDTIPEPQANTSKRTLMELKYLSDLTRNLNIKQKNLIKTVDEEPLDLFTQILRKNNLSFDKSDFDKVWSIARPVIMNLKYQYNRPRPDQLASFFGIGINVTETKTHQTPAYPSGHTSYAAFAAYLLSDMYPEYSHQFFSQVGVAGYARCLQGVHYPSDNEAAMIISGAIWEDVKYTLFPNLQPR